MATDRELRYYWNEIDRASIDQWGPTGLGERFRRLRDRYAGRQDRSPEGIIINITFALVENMGPMLMTKPPRVSCIPRRPGEERSARAKQSWLNYQARRTRLFRESRKVIKDALIYGNGYWKVGLTGFPKPLATPGERLPLNPEAPLVAATQTGSEAEGQGSYQYDSFGVWVKRISPFDLILAPGYTEIEESPYLMHRLFLPLEELRRRDDIRYKDDLTATARNAVPGERNPVGLQMASASPADDRDYVEVFEVWDQVRRKVFLLAENLRDRAIKEIDWPYPSLVNYPVKAFVPWPIPGEYQGYSMVDLIADHQDELNRLRSFAFAHVSRSGRVGLCDDQMVDEDLAAKICKAPPFSMIPVRNYRTDGIGMWPPDAGIGPELYGLNNILLEGIRLVTGFSDVAFGATTKTKSATEASIMGESLSTRITYVRKIYEDALLEVLRAIDQIGRMGVTQEEYVYVTGPDGLSAVPFRVEDARSEVDIEVIPDSTVDPPDDPVKKKQLLDFFNVAANPNVVVAAGTNVPELAAEAARAVGYVDPERFFPVLREPQSPQDENLLLVTGQRVPVHPKDDDAFHLQVHDAIATTVPPEYQPRFLEHKTLHFQALELKSRMAPSAGAGISAGMGGPTAPRMGELGLEGQGGASDNGGDLGSLLARGMQGNNR